MSKRGRKRKVKLHLKKETIQSTISIIFLVLAGIVLIALFAPDYSFNAKVNSFITDLFGRASILVPIILLEGGLIQTNALKSKFVEIRVLLGLIGIILCLSGMFSLIGFKGGMVGDNLAFGFRDALSSAGAFLIFFFGLMGLSILIMDVSFADLIEKTNVILSGLKFVKGGKSEKSDLDDIKITTGEVMLDSKFEEEEELPETINEPTFEVVPSIAEPKSEKVVVENLSGIKTHLPDPKLPYSDKIWELPPLDLLQDVSNVPVDRGDVKERAKIIVDALTSFGVDATVAEINYGPSVTQYALKASSGTRIARVSSLQHDLALALASPTGSVRIEAPIPGKSLIGIEVPNNTISPVHLKEMLSADIMRNSKSKTAIVLGKDVSGIPRVYDISKMPHLLVAGATGSGKSVFLHSLIISLLYRCSPQECKFIFVDPKRVELVHYADIPHLLTPVVTDIDKAASVFRWAVDEMNKRYKRLEAAKVRNIEAYNEKSGFQAMSYIMLVVDELAEIMVADPAQVEKSIIRLAQLARATGIHLVLTVQRPSTNVITGLIKANIPCRIAFNVTSQVDSRVIIDQPGAEKLLGKGDMLFMPPDANKPVRIQGALVTDKEIGSLVGYLKNQGLTPQYSDNIFDVKDSSRSVSAGGDAKDALFDEAAEIVTSAGKASASLLQRRLSIGYARAARILDELEMAKIIGPGKGSKPREVINAGSATNLESDIVEDFESDSLSQPIF